MGQKVHPYGFRLGIVTDWKSRWYSDTEYKELVNEDWKIRDYLNGELDRGAVSRIEIERLREKIVVEIFTGRPGVVIGRRGAEAERLREGLEKLSGRNVKLNVTEIKDVDTDAMLVAKGVADALANRVAFRRAMKRAVQQAMRAGAQGVRIELKGRLGGADMGRREWYLEGRVPLHTLRADIDYAQVHSPTGAGIVGVKVWIYKGQIMGTLAGARERRIQQEADMASGANRRPTPKARAEQAAERKTPLVIEAGGGTRKKAMAAEDKAEAEAKVKEEVTTEAVEAAVEAPAEAAEAVVVEAVEVPVEAVVEEVVAEVAEEATEAPAEEVAEEVTPDVTDEGGDADADA
jgi:small subunit ribosomal protein S3